jgi:hypothetical protein
VHDAVPDRRVDVALAQDTGPQVCPTRANILERLAGRLPVGTPHERRQLLSGAQRLALVIAEQAAPDDGQVAVAGRIGAPLCGKLGGAYPNALAIHGYCESSRGLPGVYRPAWRAVPPLARMGRKCGLMGQGSNPPAGRGVGEHRMLSPGMALRAVLCPPAQDGCDDRWDGYHPCSKTLSRWDGRPHRPLLAKTFLR